MLHWLAALQLLGLLLAGLIHENSPAQAQGICRTPELAADRSGHRTQEFAAKGPDRALRVFVIAMVLFHMANAPAGVYLGLFMRRDLAAPGRLLSYAFIASMIAWMLVVLPGGRLADRFGRRPLLICGWTTMAVRLGLLAVARSAWEVVAIQALDGLANGLFSVVAATWVTDRLADVRCAGEAQVIVGTSLVFGSAAGPALAGVLVESLGYRMLFAILAGTGALAAAIVIFAVPESRAPQAGSSAKPSPDDRAQTEHLSTALPT